ncbi:hypothetical protein QZH41_017169 [Actinostola sp. cb2023]|nr:hypothetical protein QZH41_017169 [Actinostola sp. cb2023]
MCQMKPDVIPSVGQGAEIGIKECKQQFLHERWNCTTSEHPTVFGRLLDIGSKEAAFVHAITSAGVVHAVSQSCSKGNLSECTCHTRTSDQHHRSWDLSGCTNNVNYAIWLSKTFVDAPEKVDRRTRSIRRERALMNLHNNEAGRQQVYKCQGLLVPSFMKIRTLENAPQATAKF